MANQLAYCIIQGVSPLDSTSNSYIRVRFDITSGSNTLTNVTDEGGVYSGINNVRPGQILRAGGSFTSGTTVVSVNTSSATIVVEDGAVTDETNELARIAPASGEYFIPSASLSDPQQQINYASITGSEDDEYIVGTNRFGILGKAYSEGAIIPGRFHLYEILNVRDRNPSNSDAKLYVRWYESGSEADSGDTMATTPDQSTALLEISDSNELIPIFKSRIVSGFNLDGGEEVAAYQIALEAFFDSLQTGSSAISSSYATTASFAISASYAVSSSHEIIKEISSSYADSASFAITASYALNAGSGTGFPFSGSAVITGSLLVSGSGVSGSFSGSYEGDGSNLTGIISSSYAVTASYAVSSSVEIKKEISSSHADTASLALDILWSNISNIPSGLLSSSAQIKEYNVFATTGSNLFTDDQTIDGLLILGTQSGVPTYVSGGIYVDSNYDLYLGSI
jgi:hypothetical protein